MYLDSPLKEHTLLQAIARVNRKGDDKKTYGLVVDYWGVSEALKDALAIFSPAGREGRDEAQASTCSRSSRRATPPRCGSWRR